MLHVIHLPAGTGTAVLGTRIRISVLRTLEQGNKEINKTGSHLNTEPEGQWESDSDEEVGNPKQQYSTTSDTIFWGTQS